MIAESIAFLCRAGQARRLRRRALLRRLPRRARYALRVHPRGRAGRRRDGDAVRHQRLVAALAGSRRRRRRSSPPSATPYGSGSTATTTPSARVANSLAAVEAGARQVQGTMNGCGERTGNANLVSIIANLQLKLGFRVPQRRAARAPHRDRALRRRDPQRHPRPQPALRRAQRLRPQGRHARRGRRRRRDAPSSTSTRRSSATSASCSSRSSPDGRACSRRPPTLGIELDDATAARVIGRVKELEHEGYQFEAADGSLELLLRRETGATSRSSRSSPGG